MGATDIAPERVIRRIEERLHRPDSGCWIWTGANHKGYGRVSWSLGHRRMVYAFVHRVMWAHHNGPIPEGLDLDHLCRVPACCNPAHLEPVTRQQNLLRGKTIPAERAARTHCPQGHALTPENTLISTKNQRQCKACTYERNRAYYHANKQRRKEYNAEWRIQKRRLKGQ